MLGLFRVLISNNLFNFIYMYRNFSTIVLLVLTISFLGLGSCVSKKKFLNEVSLRVVCDSTLQQLSAHNLSLNRDIASLELALAEKTGERNAFREVIDKQDLQIDQLNQELRDLADQSLDNQEAQGVALQNKKRELAEKQAVINGFKSALEQQHQKLDELVGRVRDSFPDESLEGMAFEVRKGLGRISIPEKLLFRPGSTRLNKSAYGLLEKIAAVLVQYPEMDISVVGHTDNKPVKTRSYSDNWDLSVLRASPIARVLTKDFGLNPSKVTACGKGDSKPKASNDTPEGREQNRRTELVIYPPVDKLVKMVQESK